jgi:hypothetical protein
MEIAKRLNAIIAQLLPFLSQEVILAELNIKVNVFVNNNKFLFKLSPVFAYNMITFSVLLAKNHDLIEFIISF